MVDFRRRDHAVRDKGTGRRLAAGAARAGAVVHVVVLRQPFGRGRRGRRGPVAAVGRVRTSAGRGRGHSAVAAVARGPARRSRPTVAGQRNRRQTALAATAVFAARRPTGLRGRLQLSIHKLN